MTDGPQPLLVSEAEYDVISQALVAMAEQAQSHGNTDAYALIKRFVVRMKNAVFVGGGMDWETVTKLVSKIEEDLSVGNFKLAQGAIGGLIVAVARTTHDPAFEISEHLAPMLLRMILLSAKTAQQQIGAAVLRKLHDKMETERSFFDQKGKKHTSLQTFAYLHDMVEFCAEELQHGIDPFEEETADAT